MVRLIGIGLVAGVFSSLFGVGGGIVVVPLLLLLTSAAVREVTAISLGGILITSIVGVVLYAFRGEVRPAHALLVGGPAVVGALVGTHLQQGVSNRSLTLGFAALLAVVGGWLLGG